MNGFRVMKWRLEFFLKLIKRVWRILSNRIVRLWDYVCNWKNNFGREEWRGVRLDWLIVYDNSLNRKGDGVRSGGGDF